MKKIAICLSVLLMSQLSYAGAHLDLNRGSVLRCQGQVGELNRVGLRAEITSTKTADGGLELKVISEISQCIKNASGKKNWAPLSKPEATNSFGLLKLKNLKLMVSTEEGDLISSTNLNLQDSQTIKISAETVRKIDGQLLDVGATAQQDFEVNGEVVDQRPVYFGSYLISN